MTAAIYPIPPMNTEVYMSTPDETIEQEIKAKGLTAEEYRRTIIRSHRKD